MLIDCLEYFVVGRGSRRMVAAFTNPVEARDWVNVIAPNLPGIFEILDRAQLIAVGEKEGLGHEPV